MKSKCVMVFLLALFFLSLYPTFPANVEAQTEPDVFVGVHLGYGDVAEAKALIDRTASCANFVLIGTSRIFYDQQKLTETFQYAYDNDMYFMSFAPSIPHSEEGPSPRDLWFAYANQTWGDRLVGFYAYDEPGGQILDGELLPLWKDEGMPPNSVEAAENFKDYLTWRVDLVRSRNLGYWNYPLFTADYGLYWFNYKGGYDGLFAEFVANYSRQLTVSLVRGAAQIQNRQWGILIGWKYDYSPYLASGEELFEDMVFAYDSGAKYILVFDSNNDWTSDILEEEHIDAMEQFWQYVEDNPRKDFEVSERTVLVLPDAYGCGFRWPGDKLWGIWDQDLTSETVNLAISNMLKVYGDKLDIVFDDDLSSFSSYGYSQLIRWDDPEALPTPTPTATPTSSPTPSSTLTPEPTSTPDNGFSIPIEGIIGIAAVAIIIIAVVGFKLIKK